MRMVFLNGRGQQALGQALHSIPLASFPFLLTHDFLCLRPLIPSQCPACRGLEETMGMTALQSLQFIFIDVKSVICCYQGYSLSQTHFECGKHTEKHLASISGWLSLFWFPTSQLRDVRRVEREGCTQTSQVFSNVNILWI